MKLRLPVATGVNESTKEKLHHVVEEFSEFFLAQRDYERTAIHGHGIKEYEANQRVCEEGIDLILAMYTFLNAICTPTMVQKTYQDVIIKNRVRGYYDDDTLFDPEE